MSALELMAAFAAQNRVSRAIGAFFTGHDLLVTPTLAQLPAPHGALRYDGAAHTPASRTRALLDYGPFTAVFNVSGQPAMQPAAGRQRERTPDRRAARRALRM